MRSVWMVGCCAAVGLVAQTITFEEYTPKSTLVVPAHPRTQAKYPFVDVHGHPRQMGSPEKIDQLIKEMDAMNMRMMVNLDGRSGEPLKKTLANMRGKYPDRFVVFANIDFANIDDPNWTNKTANQLEQDIKNGASGLKIYKNLGMDVKDSKGQRVKVDDPRLDPVMAV